MRFPLLCIAIASLAFRPPCHAMSKKEDITVRFHTEANRNDSDTFSIPVNLLYQRRQAYLSKVAGLSEKQIEKILPFPAPDGSWGCVFKFNPMGRIRLEAMSAEIRGSALVVFVSTKAGHHQVADMIVDRPVTDGIITVPRGLTEFEIEMLKKQFKILGMEVKQNWRDKPKEKPAELPGGRFETPKDRNSIYQPISTAPGPRRRGSPELNLPELPRLSD